MNQAFKKISSLFNKDKKSEMSVEKFESLKEELTQMVNDEGIVTEENNKFLLIEVINYALEGDKNPNNLFFEHFQEFNMLQLLLDIDKKLNSSEALQEVKQICSSIQLIEQLSFLLCNLKHKQHIYYILSHRILMYLLEPHFENYKNSDFAESYINFLKALSIRITPDTINFFINHKVPHFPLLWNAIRFNNYPGILVQNTSRLIVFLILQKLVPNQLVQKYAINFPFITYYYDLGEQMIQIALKMIHYYNQIEEENNYRLFSDICEEFIELVQFIADFQGKIKQLEHIIQKYILKPFLNLVISKLLKTNVNIIYNNLKNQNEIEIILQILLLMLQKFEDISILSFFAIILIPPSDAINLKEEWSFRKVWDDDQQFIIDYARKILLGESFTTEFTIKQENEKINKHFKIIMMSEIFIDLNEEQIDFKSLFFQLAQRIQNDLILSLTISFLLEIIANLKNPRHSALLQQFLHNIELLKPLLDLCFNCILNSSTQLIIQFNAIHFIATVFNLYSQDKKEPYFEKLSSNPFSSSENQLLTLILIGFNNLNQTDQKDLMIFIEDLNEDFKSITSNEFIIKQFVQQRNNNSIKSFDDFLFSEEPPNYYSIMKYIYILIKMYFISMNSILDLLIEMKNGHNSLSNFSKFFRRRDLRFAQRVFKQQALISKKNGIPIEFITNSQIQVSRQKLEISSKARSSKFNNVECFKIGDLELLLIVSFKKLFFVQKDKIKLEFSTKEDFDRFLEMIKLQQEQAIQLETNFIDLIQQNL